MDNYKEYLDPKDNYLFVKWPLSKPVDPDWIEIPEGTEVIRMNCQGSLNFYAKINGHWAIKNKVDMENWYQPKTYSSHFDADDGSLPIIWERPTQDPALISGADALRALADGKEVEFLDEELDIPWTKILTEKDERNAIEPCISMFFDGYREIKFRLKPQTIKVELELPKPFEPKEGDLYWFITCRTEKGYSCRNHKARHGDYGMQYGAYRSEEEIKQVVEQLRKIRGAS